MSQCWRSCDRPGTDNSHGLRRVRKAKSSRDAVAKTAAATSRTGLGSAIAPAAIQPKEFATVGAHFDRLCRHLVVRVDPLEAVPPSVVSTSHKFDPAIPYEADDKEHAEPLIGEVTSETLLVPLDQVAFAGG